MYGLRWPALIVVLVATMQRRLARGPTAAYDQQAVTTSGAVSSPKCTTCQDWQECGQNMGEQAHLHRLGEAASMVAVIQEQLNDLREQCVMFLP